VSIPPAWPQVLDFFGAPLVIEPSPGQLSGDAGFLPIRQFDQRTGLTRAFAQALDDPRDPDLTEHTLLEMVRARVYGILAGYFDRNDPSFQSRTGRHGRSGVPYCQPDVARRRRSSMSPRSARGGLIDMRAQAEVPSARRTDTRMSHRSSQAERGER
jgi:hypothetical protein